MQPTKYAGRNYLKIVRDRDMISLVTEGVDECDTAAMMYDCGKALVPNLMTDLVSTLELKNGVRS
jgi:hypothetical protein